MRNVRWAPWFVVGAVVIAVVWVLVALRITREETASLEPDLRMPLGYSVTEGAAPGYLADTVCATCHLDLYTSYQHVGMAQSFARPRPENFIEDFEAAPYFHAASKSPMKPTILGWLCPRRYRPRCTKPTFLRNYLETPHDVIPSDRRESRDLAGSALLDLFGEIPPLTLFGRNDKKGVLR